MKKLGQCSIAEQSGSKGYFGTVEVEVEENGNGNRVTVDFDPENAAEWQSGARFGIEYVLEHISTRSVFPHGGKVHVGRILGHPVDTNNVVIAYAAARALLDALEIATPKSPNFDKSTGCFVFLK